MGRIRIKKDSKAKAKISFEDDITTLESLIRIAKEVKKRLKRLRTSLPIIIILFLVSFIIHLEIAENYFNDIFTPLFIYTLVGGYVSLKMTWTLTHKSPSLNNYIKEELNKMGYRMIKPKKPDIILPIVGTLFFLLIIFFENLIIQEVFNNIITGILAIITLLISFVFPLLFLGWMIFYMNPYVKLKKKYKIELHFKMKTLKFQTSYDKEIEAPTLWILLSSNMLIHKKDKILLQKINEIAEKRGIQKDKKYFELYSTPLNFQKQFLNIASALREWDIYYNSDRLRSNHKYDKAIRFLELYIQKDPNDISLYIRKCEILVDSIENTDGDRKYNYIKNLKKTISNGLRLEPYNFELLTFQGVFGKEQSKAFYKNYFNIISNKKEFFKKFKELPPYKRLIRKDIDIYFGMLIKEKKFDEILKKIDSVLEIDPENTKLYLDKSYILAAELSKYGEALEVIEKGLRVDDRNIFLYIYKARILLENDKLDEANRILEKALEMNKNDDLVLSELASLLIVKEEYNKALQYIEQAIKNNSEDMNYYGVKAQILLDLGKESQALEIINRGIENDAKNPYLNFIKTKILGLVNKLEEALTAINISIEFWPEYDENYYYKALILNEMGKYEEALVIINLGIKFNPKNALFLVLKAQILENLENFQTALEITNLAIKLSTNISMAYNIKADILAQFEDFDSALKEIDKAIDLDADMPQYHNTKSQILKVLKRNKEAIIEIDKAITLDPQAPELLANKALILGQLDRFEDCLEIINKAIEINPEKTGFYREKSLILFELEDFASSLEIIEKAISKDPTKAEYLFIKSQALNALKKYDEELLTLNELLEMDSNNTNALNNKAMALTKMKRNEEAMKIMQNLIDSQPMNGIYNDTFGVILMKNGNYKDAIQKFKLTIELDPQADFIHETYINMGKCYLKIGDIDNALETLIKGKMIAEKRNDSKWIKKAEKSISTVNSE